MSLLLLSDSSMTVNALTVRNISSEKALISVINSFNTSISYSSFSNISSGSNNIIRIMNSGVDLMKDIEISNSPHIAFQIIGSVIDDASQIHVSEAQRGFYLKNSQIVQLSDSSFQNLGSFDLLQGLAMHVVSSSVNVANSTFLNNTAKSGAAVSINCNVGDVCSNKITNTTFENNRAEVKGGAIYYNSYRPEISDIVFTNNSAEYGPNIASYPVKIIKQGSETDEIELNDVGSGVSYSEELKLALVDYDSQEIATDNTSQIKIISKTEGSSVSGVDYAKLEKGVGPFNDLQFISTPGSRIEFQATSKAIPTAMIESVFGSQFSENTVDVSFRSCQPGEIQLSTNVCQTCAQGTFSLDWNSTSCSQCMDSAVCLGHSEVVVNPGYWRRTLNSTTIIECPREDSCRGGYQTDQLFPVDCAEGYEGYLCTSCQINGGTKYQRIGIYECEKCPDPVMNAIRVIGLLLLILVFLSILTIVNLKKREESQTSILTRIFTNYLQLIATAMSFNLKYPTALINGLYPIERVGATSESFLSFDCFVEDVELNGFAPSTVLFKLFLTAILPLILMLIVAIVWSLLFLTKFSWFADLKRNIIVSIICIMFLLHPTLTKQALSIFQCTTVDEGEQRMTIDMTVE